MRTQYVVQHPDAADLVGPFASEDEAGDYIEKNRPSRGFAEVLSLSEPGAVLLPGQTIEVQVNGEQVHLSETWFPNAATLLNELGFSHKTHSLWKMRRGRPAEYETSYGYLAEVDVREGDVFRARASAH